MGSVGHIRPARNPHPSRSFGYRRAPCAPRRRRAPMPLTADGDIRELLEETRTIALVGASDRPDRPSNGVMKTLQAHGYRVIPVNPQLTGEHIHGEFVFRELAQLGDPIDMVDIF